MPSQIANSLGDRVLEKCLTKAGLPGNVSDKLGSYIPEVALNRFLDFAAKSAGDDLFGLHLAHDLSVTDYGVWGDYVLEAANLRAALERAARIIHLHADKDTLEVRQGPNSTFFRYTFGERTSVGYRQTALAALGPMLSVPRYFLGSQWLPSSIGLDLKETRCEAQIEAQIGTAIRGDRSCVFLEIANSDLVAPNPHGTEGCTTVGDVKRACRGGPPTDLVPCLEHLILQRLGSQDVGLDDIAWTIGTSMRTLQRKIDLAGTNFRSICLSAKMCKARELLTESSATVSSIALQLDYSTASHFARAFRKQYGVGPMEYKKLKITQPLQLS